ncbi:MAG: hypothetical protein NT038_01285 [Euryarchaeota archaeon]|nr:hypothetical protein [Euryarchaeota archaeon]
MDIKRVATGYLLPIFLLLCILPTPGSSQDTNVPTWNPDWSYQQQIPLPISTNTPSAVFQSIDIHISFTNPCWAKNETQHSIRVCCWDGNNWHELESQIYDLQYVTTDTIKECSIVFLVPEYANGNEQYHVYYDDQEKPSVTYKDHVSVEDSYYFSSPIAGISAEASYYGVKQDGYYIYGVGQKGQFLDRCLSQVIMKQKPKTSVFDILNADQIASFAFSYATGKKDTDEISSDQTFISKKIKIDGNIMVEFGIISETSDGSIRTTVIYKYYYTPQENKRISVHVKHQTSKDLVVRGEENIDGRYGSLLSFKSRNAAMQKLNFGDIQPYLDFAGDNSKVEEYAMNTNPETKDREWVISYMDDADLGNDAWLSYGNGIKGKSQALIFASNTGFVTQGTEERDGIQIKVAEREYFNFLGTEIDYAAINFGRNSYEKGSTHDLFIPRDLIVEFDAELFTAETDGYTTVQNEAALYQTLIKNRGPSADSLFEQEQKTFDVTVVTHYGGTWLSFPFIVNRTQLPLPVMIIELYHNEQLITSSMVERILLTRSYTTFHNLTEGTYVVKVYRKTRDANRLFVGAEVIDVPQKTMVRVMCTWQRNIFVQFSDQDAKGISGITVFLLNKDQVILVQNTTNEQGEAQLNAPYSTRDSYQIQAYYRGFRIYNQQLKNTLWKLDIPVTIGLYDLTVELRDSLDLPPDVVVHPTLFNPTYPDAGQISSVETTKGTFYFEDIPEGTYTLQASYADMVNEQEVTIPDDGTFIQMPFTAAFNLQIKLFDAQGNPLNSTSFTSIYIRQGKEVYQCTKGDLFCTLPPAAYIIKVYQQDTLVGQTEISLTNDRTVQIVTTLQSMLPTILSGIASVVLGLLIIFVLLKKVSVAGLLKGGAIALLLLSVIQPWWSLVGSCMQPPLERTTHMYLDPPVMIESTTINGQNLYSLAAMPDIFIDFLGKLPFVLYVACALIGINIILKRFGQKKVAWAFNVGCIVFLFAFLSVYYTGASKLCEASIGQIQGEGIINFMINDATVAFSSHWGLGIGFFLVLLASLLLILATLWDVKHRFLRKRNREKREP